MREPALSFHDASSSGGLTQVGFAGVGGGSAEACTLSAPPAGLPSTSSGLWGSPSSALRDSAELQVLVSGDVELELVGIKEVAQLLDIALVQPVHFLLRGVQCLLHLDGLSHCKAERRAVVQHGSRWVTGAHPRRKELFLPSLPVLIPGSGLAEGQATC